MTAPKERLHELSMSQLEMLTGICYRTIKRRLEPLTPVRMDANTIFYNPRQALPLIYEVVEKGGPVKLDGDQEKARLSKVQADIRELELARQQEELLLTEDVESTWDEMITAARAKLLGIPTKTATMVFGAESIAVAQDILTRAIHEALHELSHAREPEDLPEEPPEDLAEDDDEMETTSEADGLAVG